VAPNEADPSIRVRGNYLYNDYRYGLGATLYPAIGATPAQYTISWNTLTGGAYTYTGCDLATAPRTRVAIDPNVRVRGNGTYAGIEDVDGAITLNEPVEVYEPESGLTGQGRVTDIDADRGFVYLSVDWSSLMEETPQQQPPAPQGHILYISVGQATSGHDWLESSAQPSLAYVTSSGMTLQVTAPAKGWWEETSPPGAVWHYPGISQPYAELTTNQVVVK
jgi:hypothetical protein